MWEWKLAFGMADSNWNQFVVFKFLPCLTDDIISYAFSNPLCLSKIV